MFMDRNQEKEMREEGIKQIPRRILELEFEIEELKETYKIHKSRLDEIIWEEQQELKKAMEEF